jgi:hypothetical protein
MPPCSPAVSLRASGASPLVPGIVCPDDDLALLVPAHRPSCERHAIGIKAKWLIHTPEQSM